MLKYKNIAVISEKQGKRITNLFPLKCYPLKVISVKWAVINNYAGHNFFFKLLNNYLH